MILIFSNLFRFILWPKYDIPWRMFHGCLRRVCPIAIGWNILNVFVRPIRFKIQFKSKVSLLIFDQSCCCAFLQLQGGYPCVQCCGGQLHALVWSWEPGMAVRIVAVMSLGVQGVHNIAGWVAQAVWGRLTLLESANAKTCGVLSDKSCRESFSSAGYWCLWQWCSGVCDGVLSFDICGDITL